MLKRTNDSLPRRRACSPVSNSGTGRQANPKSHEPPEDEGVLRRSYDDPRSVPGEESRSVVTDWSRMLQKQALFDVIGRNSEVAKLLPNDTFDHWPSVADMAPNGVRVVPSGAQRRKKARRVREGPGQHARVR